MLITWLKRAMNVVAATFVRLRHMISPWLTVLVGWLKKAIYSVGASFVRLGHIISALAAQNTCRLKGWFRKHRQNLIATVIVVAFLYFIPYTFMLAGREKTIVGIVLQILAGAVLILDQISSNPRIRKQVTKVTRQPPLFALLMTIIVLPFVISILTTFDTVPSDKWVSAFGITFFIALAYAMFIVSLTLLRRIKWLRRKGDVPMAEDKLEISDFSVRNMGILFGFSLLVMVLLLVSLWRLSHFQAPWIQILWLLFFLAYGFTLLPLLIISPLYVLGFWFAKIANYIRIKKSLEVWFWIFLFVLWVWGGLLLISKEFM
jgi:hypothetical protein